MTAHESSAPRPGGEERWECPIVQDLLPLYLEGEVSPDSRSLIAEHLSVCRRCAGFLAGVESTRAQIGLRPNRALPQAANTPVPSATHSPVSRFAVATCLALLLLAGVSMPLLPQFFVTSRAIETAPAPPMLLEIAPTSVPFRRELAPAALPPELGPIIESRERVDILIGPLPTIVPLR